MSTEETKAENVPQTEAPKKRGRKKGTPNKSTPSKNISTDKLQAILNGKVVCLSKAELKQIKNALKILTKILVIDK